MEVDFTFELATGDIIDVTASVNVHGLLEWGVTTRQSARPSALLSQIIRQEDAIDARAWDKISEREAHALEERRDERCSDGEKAS